MLSRFSSILQTALLFSQAAVRYLHLRRFLSREYAPKIVLPVELQEDYDYYSSVYNRTQQYMHANYFFGEWLCLLRGKKMNTKEMKQFALLSSCAPVFDDLFEEGKDSEHTRKLMHFPNISEARNASEKTAAFFFSQILNALSNRDQLIDAADCLFDAQQKSKSQKDKKCSFEELLHISVNKGGYSGLMYALLLEPPHSDVFLNLAFELGSYGQLMDDIFDLYDDAQQGIQTFANQSGSVQDIRLIIEEREQVILEKLSKSSFAVNDRKSFLRVLHLFSNIIEIALLQYEKTENIKGVHPQQCLSIDRKYWLVDMEKASNIWKLFTLSAKPTRS